MWVALPFCSRAIFLTFSRKSERTVRYGITVLSSCEEIKENQDVLKQMPQTNKVQIIQAQYLR